MTEIINHLSQFIADLWQIHPFRKDNTLTTAVFLIKSLRSMGIPTTNDMFKEHSWYFRNALVRANYRNALKGIEPTTEYLVLFFRNLIIGENNELKNRYLHIRWNDAKPQNDVLEATKRQNDVLETSEAQNVKLTLKEMAVVRMITADSKISIASMTTKTGLSRRTIDRIIVSLKEKGILTREGAKNNATWIILNSFSSDQKHNI